MKNSAIKLYEVDEFIDSLKGANQVFKLEKTTSTTRVHWENQTFKHTKGAILKISEIAFLRKVHKHVSENVAGVHCDASKITYTKHGKLKSNYWYKKDIYEVDLNAAYWNFAHKSGYINDKLFWEGKKVSKMCRLVSLGNLAKNTIVLNFDGNEFNKIETIKSEATQGVFFDVSRQTDEVMKWCRVIANNDFLFYWVDAIFLQGETALNNVVNHLLTNDIPYKIKPIDKIKKTSNEIEVHDEKGKRVFMFKK